MKKLFVVISSGKYGHGIFEAEDEADAIEACAKAEGCERTTAYRGGSFLLQREPHHQLRRVMATYILSTGVDSRATHGTL